MIEILLVGLKASALMVGILLFIFIAVVVLSAICKAIESLSGENDAIEMRMNELMEDDLK